MILILIKLSHLFLIFNIAVNGLPIINTRSDISNNESETEQRAVTPKGHMDKFPGVPITWPKYQAPKNFNVSQVVKNLKNFGFDSLKHDHHMEGLPLDGHGKVNPDFHKEVFLGNHELFASDISNDKQRRNKKLEGIFSEADVDHDKRLTREELVNHLFRNVQQHLKEAKDKNAQLFVLIDTNKDGKITWHEYFSLYIMFHHMNASSLTDLNDINFIQDSYDSNLRRELLKIRFRWTDTDGGGDNELDIDEFLAFRHPETAGRLYRYIVDNIMEQLDRDDDQKLNETEFVYMPLNALEDRNDIEWIKLEKKRSEERRREFREMDANGDGIVTRDDLLKAFNPMNREHINKQIRALFSVVDDSPRDNELSLNEIKKHADVFTDMRILDREKELHEEI